MKMTNLPVLVLFFIAASIHGEPASRLSQADVFANVRNHELVQQALINLALKSQALTVENGWKGPQLALIPSLTYDDAIGGYEIAESAIGLDVVIPLGLSAAEKERKLLALDSYRTAAAQYDEAFGKAFSDLFVSYSDAYAAQEAVVLADREAELARLKLESFRLKVARGISAFSEQTDAEAEYQAAAEKTIQTRLDLRLAYFNFAFLAGIETIGPASGGSNANLDIPKFEAPDYTEAIKNVPQPGILMSRAKTRNSDAIVQMQKLSAAKRNAENLSTYDLNVTPKVSYATPDFSASAGYGTANGAITLGTDWTPYQSEAASSRGPRPPDHSITLSIGISGNLSPVKSAEKEVLNSAIKLEERKLSALERSLELLIRSRYAAYLKARDSVSGAERANALAVETSAITKTKGALGQLSAEDEAAAAVLMLRSSYGIVTAKIGLARAYLNLLSAANAWDLAGIVFSGK